MTLLARRREELARAARPEEAVEESRAPVVRPRPQARGFFLVQEALGNRAAGSLLGAGRVQSEASRLLVADGEAPGPGQMTRSAFLASMREAARQAAEAGLAGTGHTARGCPWIEHYFRFYQRLPAERIEADLARYVPAAAKAMSAEELLDLAAAHVRASVEHWARTGELAGVPRGLPGMALLAAVGGSLTGVGQRLREARIAESSAVGAGDPAAVEVALGPGRALESSARSRMERAFGTGFGDVRLHTDSTAARLARGLGARAFAVGDHVAFAPGEYRPGTLVGDALLAHELAHTLQQRGAGTTAAPRASASIHHAEGDANVAAAGVVGRLWAGGRRLARGLAPRPRPRLRLGLTLAACRENFSDEELRAYLKHVEGKRTEGGFLGDNKARAVVREIPDPPDSGVPGSAGMGRFQIDDVHVQWMIEEMLEGSVGEDDQLAILKLLETSNADRLKFLFIKGGLTAKRLFGEISGDRKKRLMAFFDRRFEDGVAAQRPIPDADFEELPPSQDANRGFRPEDLQRLDDEGKSLTFKGDLSPLPAEAQKKLLDNITATVHFVLDAKNQLRIQEVETLRLEWEEATKQEEEAKKQGKQVDKVGPFFDTPGERLDSTDLYHGHVCLPPDVFARAEHRDLQELRSEGLYQGHGDKDKIKHPTIQEEIRTAIEPDPKKISGGPPTTRPQARRVMAVVEKHRVPFREALARVMEALDKVPEAGVQYHTWERTSRKFKTGTMGGNDPIRNIFTPFSSNQPTFDRRGQQDCAELINFSFHVNRRGEVTLLPEASGEMVRAFEILNPLEQAPSTPPAPEKPQPAPAGGTKGPP